MMSNKFYAILAIAIGVAIAVPIYVIGSLALVRAGHQERLIVTINTVIDEPTGYAGVKLAIAYHYQKSEHRLRAVVTLPEGYPGIAGEGSGIDTGSVTATNILPAWACRIDPSSDFADYGSFQATDQAAYLQSGYNNLNDYVVPYPGTMWLLNPPGTNGLMILTDAFDTVLNNDLWLGAGYCGIRFNDTWCFENYLAEVTHVLGMQADIDAWNSHYDAAAV